MRILVLHLSDIHIRGNTDTVLARAGRIADSVKDLESRLDLCLIVITGDIAFAGTSEQYDAARRWIADLKDKMNAALEGNLAVEILVIPGNHDCDLSTSRPARAHLIDAMVADPAIAADPSCARTCVEPQAAFFAFRAQVGAKGLSSDGYLYYEYRFTVDAETVLVRCLNTAWVSENPERPAHLTFPVAEIPLAPPADGRPRDTLVLSLMHHTYNWLAPTNIRAVRRRLQSVSDFVLTGHEHMFGLSQQTDEHGGGAIYVEGIALQGHGLPPASGFNALVVDTAVQRYRVIPFTWQSAHYEEDSEAPCRHWCEYDTNPIRAGHLFPVSQRMRERLADPGVTLSHPLRGSLTLDDIFVYPDLRAVAAEPGHSKQAPAVGADRMLHLAREAGCILISGDDESGKTTLAKRLFADAIEQGLVPLILDGRRVRLVGTDRDRKELGRIFEEQYDAKGGAYLDLPKDLRVILLDDASFVSHKAKSAGSIVSYLSHFAGAVLLFADRLTQLVQDLSGLAPLAVGKDSYPHYSLLPMGHLRREELIDRYVALATDDDLARAEALRADMRRILAAAVGKYFAPPTPIAVVSILQARAFNEQLNLQQVTYGYYYELLIKRQLWGQSAEYRELDVRLAYLVELAYHAFVNGQVRFTEAWLMAFHLRFVSERMLTLEFRDMVGLLLERGILEKDESGFAFRHAYVLHYFVARALAARLVTDEGRTHIASLTGSLHEQASANILLFLTHLSKDAEVLEPMLKQADSLFEGIKRAELTATGNTLPGLNEALRGAVFVDQPGAELRRQMLQRLDESEDSSGEEMPSRVPIPGVRAQQPSEEEDARRDERDDDMRDVISVVARINISLRTMQILGQVLKNFPGTLTGAQKEAITRAVYGVALRTLGFVHELFRAHTEEFAEQVVNALPSAHPNLSSADLVKAGRETVYWQMYAAALGIIQRTAMDIGNPLLDPVFAEIEARDGVPSVRLISLALKLDRAGAFPVVATKRLFDDLGRNPMAHRILQGLVVAHFYMFEVPHDTKQSVSALVGIEYRPMLPRSRRRLIGPAE